MSQVLDYRSVVCHHVGIEIGGDAVSDKATRIGNHGIFADYGGSWFIGILWFDEKTVRMPEPALDENRADILDKHLSLTARQGLEIDM